MSVCGIDYSTHAVDIVLLDEDSDAATWHRFELAGRDSFDRARNVRDLFAGASLTFRDKWESVLAFGIEDPRGYGAGHLYRIQGAILTKIPRGSLVQPWIPGQWRKAVGLSGAATKVRVAEYVYDRHISSNFAPRWPQDACDAYCIALATRNALQRTEAA